MKTVHTRSTQLAKGQTFSIILPNGGGSVVAYEGETIYVIVAHSYEAAVGEALRKLNATKVDE